MRGRQGTPGSGGEHSPGEGRAGRLRRGRPETGAVPGLGGGLHKWPERTASSGMAVPGGGELDGDGCPGMSEGIPQLGEAGPSGQRTIPV